jgi:hypothetical protein
MIDNKEEQKKALFEAWKVVFEQNREYSEKALEEILSKYERRCGKQCFNDINLEEVEAVLNLRKISVAQRHSFRFPEQEPQSPDSPLLSNDTPTPVQ